jgi:Tol biopolymer transport system component
MPARYSPATRAVMLALVPGTLFVSFDLRQLLIVLLIAVGVVIAALPLLAPKARPIWRYSIWSCAVVLGLGVMLSHNAGGAKSNQPSAPRIVKSDSAASGVVYWANNNMVDQFNPATGTQKTVLKLPPGSEISDLALSPDGKSFALVYAPATNDTEGGIQLAVVPRAGGTPRQLLSHEAAGGDLGHAVWSPDGRYVFVMSTPPKSTLSSLLRVSLDGSKPLKIADNAGEPACTPDGQTLIFVHTDPNAGNAQLWRANLDGSNTKPLSSATYTDIVSPAVSPDGKTLAFSAPYIPPVQGNANPHLPLFGPARASAHGGNWEVWTLPLSGGNAKVRTAIGEFRPRIAWSPASDQIAINADLGLYVINLNQNKDSLFDIYTGTGIVWTR